MSFRKRALVAAALAALAALAGPGRAAPVDPPDAPRIRIARVQPESPAALSLLPNSSSSPGCFDLFGSPATCDPATMLQVQYYGGKVIPNAKVYAVFWTPAVNATTQADIGPFYRGITNSAWMDWYNEYATVGFTPGSNQRIGRGTFASAITITPVTTGHTCVKDSTGHTPTGVTCIWDTDIPAELDGQISAGHLPAPDAHTIYMFHFPASFVIQSADRTNKADSCVQYCAFHGTYTRTGYGSVYYGVLPDLGANGCQNGCGPGATFANLCSASSHELGEAMTDAEVGLASTLAPPLGWYDGGSVSQGEIGDMCNQSTSLVTSLADGLSYTVQNMFSKSIWDANPVPSTRACVSTRLAANDFSVFFNPNGQSVASGGNASIPVRLETTSGSASAVTLAVSSLSTLPAGVHASPSLASVSSVPAGSAAVANLNVTVDPGTATATDLVLVLNATAGSLVHSASVLLQVTPAAGNDWSLSLSPPGRAVLPGGTATYTVSGAVTAGSAEAVSLSGAAVTGLPSGVTASFTPSAITPGSTTATLTLTASAGAVPAPATTFTVKGTSASQPGGHTQTAQVTVDGLPAVSIAAPANGATVAGSVPITLNASAGANTAIAGTVIRIDGAVYSGPLPWDTTTVADGTHTLDATVTDADGGSASATQVSVRVGNPYRLYTVTPCRVFDTRTTATPALAASEIRAFAAAGACAIPATARSIVANLTVTGAGASGNLVAWAAGDPVPTANSLSFRSGVTRANNGVIRLGTGGAIDVQNQSAASVNVILDVSGYYQ
jgi:hypothetical protein